MKYREDSDRAGRKNDFCRSLLYVKLKKMRKKTAQRFQVQIL